MTIHGLQKLTILDFPGKTACTVFTAGVTALSFCHNSSLVTKIKSGAVMTEYEFFAISEKTKGILDGYANRREPLITNKCKGLYCKNKKKKGFQVSLFPTALCRPP